MGKEMESDGVGKVERERGKERADCAEGDEII